jgi:hypothetical protein
MVIGFHRETDFTNFRRSTPSSGDALGNYVACYGNRPAYIVFGGVLRCDWFSILIGGFGKLFYWLGSCVAKNNFNIAINRSGGGHIGSASKTAARSKTKTRSKTCKNK